MSVPKRDFPVQKEDESLEFVARGAIGKSDDWGE